MAVEGGGLGLNFITIYENRVLIRVDSSSQLIGGRLLDLGRLLLEELKRESQMRAAMKEGTSLFILINGLLRE